MHWEVIPKGKSYFAIINFNIATCSTLKFKFVSTANAAVCLFSLLRGLKILTESIKLNKTHQKRDTTVCALEMV
jgi:hypothetical protein